MKGYNLILEGCDGVGKSTLFRRLLDNGDFMIGLHTGPPKSKESYKNQLVKEINALNHSVGIVYDRFSLSECVYAPMLRGYYPEYMRELEKTIKPHNILVLLTAPSGVIEERYDGLVLKKNQIAECLDRYHLEFQKCNFEHKFIINAGILDANEVYVHLFKELKKAGFEYSYYLEELLKGKL